jgi:carboxymethylenebutenolidase
VIYWDQASVFVQVGPLKPEGLPVACLETARKVVDQKLPSNRVSVVEVLGTQRRMT